MGFSRARGVALLVIATLAASLGTVLGVSAPASAAVRAPTVSVRQTGPGVVSVSGRTAARAPRVKFYRSTASGWTFVKRTRAHRHHYATTLSVAAGTTATFRVTSRHRSRRFVVQMAPQKTAQPQLYDDCGARPRKADGTAWSCTFHDEFTGSRLDRTKWVPQTAMLTGDPTAGFACYVDDPDNISVGSGMLNLTVRKETVPVPCVSAGSTISSPYTAGSISTYHLFSQQYGRFQARTRSAVSNVAGLHEAFWLWPDDRVPSTVSWPEAGEIDISETYSVYKSLSIPFLHYSLNTPTPGVNTAWNCTANRGQWNTYTLEWSPTRLLILVNGKTCLTNTSGDPAFKKPYIVAFTAALGSGTNVMSSSTPIPATMNVDYVRVWH
jgi:beta-glucanase (GH16 family)